MTPGFVPRSESHAMILSPRVVPDSWLATQRRAADAVEMRGAVGGAATLQLGARGHPSPTSVFKLSGTSPASVRLIRPFPFCVKSETTFNMRFQSKPGPHLPRVLHV